jgi:histidine triad (HIT) family protein
MTDCIFCKIVAGEIPSYKIYEDENYLAFLDIYPSAEGHTLVIPKKHVDWVWDSESLGEYFEVVGKVARHYREISKDIVRSNIDGWQVQHAHIHLKIGKVGNQNPVEADPAKLKETVEKYKF